MQRRKLEEAGSFVPLDLRIALSADGAETDATRARQGVVLACDVVGFSHLSNRMLESDENGVDALHQLLDRHFKLLLERITARGGKPLFLFGDALLCAWDEDPADASDAARAATGAALELAQARRSGELPLDLNLHVASGGLQLVEAGGHNRRWHTCAVGSAMAALQRIALLRAPNEVIVHRDLVDATGRELRARALAPEAAVVEAMKATGARPRPPVVAPPPEPETLDFLLAHAPKSVRRWLSTLGLQWVAELRPVTAVLVALRDFDQSAPEAPDRLDALVRRIQECVHARDGSIDNVMIDDKGAAVLSVFGVPPDAHSDDPLRGVLSALDLRESLAEMGQEVAVSVCTGRAFCAVIGNRHLRAYMVVGDVVTRASRICTSISPGDGILVDGATMRATQSAIGYDETPKRLELRGFAGRTPAWRVTAREAWSAQEASLSGREAETDRLHALWERASEHGASVGVALEGEPGAGKTTLALALRDRVVRDGGLFLVSGASSVDTQVPLAGLRRLAMEALGVTPAMSTDARRRTILERTPRELLDLAPLLEALFATGLDETEATQELGGAARAEALEAFLLKLFASAFGEARVCLCFEDGHWLDPRTLDVLGRLIRAASGLMVMVLRQSAAAGRGADDLEVAGFETLRLGALSEAGLEALIRARLGGAAVDPELLSRVRDASGGHPFFASELLQSLLDEGRIGIEAGRARMARTDGADEIRFPETVYGAVLQRLDRMEPEPQLSLRVAAVPGQTFTLRLAVSVHPLSPSPETAMAHYDEHVRRGFLDARMIEGDQGFGFRHGIVREVAYSQLPVALRRKLHLEVARWLEAIPERRSEGGLAELAYHWSEAGETEKAIACLAEEAARVFGQGFATQAVSLGLKAVALSGREAPETEEALRAEIGANMAAIQELAGGRAPTRLARELGEPGAESGPKLMALLATAPFAFQSNRFELFAWLASSSVRLALESGCGGPHEFSLYSVMVAALTGDRALGAEWSRAALELDARRGGDGLPAVGFLDTWFHAHWREPMADSARTNRRAARRALEAGDIQYASYNIAGEVVLTAAAGAPLDTVMELGRAALENPLVRNSQMQVHQEIQFARALRGETEHPRSLTGAGVAEDDAIAWVTRTEFVNQIGYYLATRVKLERHAGAWTAALEAAEQAAPVRPAIAGQTAEIDLVFHAALARLALMIADPEARAAQRAALEEELDQLSLWKSVQPANFAAKAEIVAAALEGLEGDPRAAADRLAAIAADLGPDLGLQDRALALEYAARLDPSPARARAAGAAFREWGATALAARLEAELG